MKLKCVGGPNNGEYGNTYDDKPRVGEAVRIAESHVHFGMSMKDSLKYYVYTVDRDCDGLFLRPL